MGVAFLSLELVETVHSLLLLSFFKFHLLIVGTVAVVGDESYEDDGDPSERLPKPLPVSLEGLDCALNPISSYIAYELPDDLSSILLLTIR